MKRWAVAVILLAVAQFASVPSACAAGQLPADWDERIKLGVLEYERGENYPAFETFSKLMTEGARKVGPADGRLARIYVNMGEVYDQKRQYAYAEQCLKRGLNIAQTGYGANSMQVVPALIDLAQTYVHQARDAQALPLFKRALTIVDKPGDSSLLPYVAVIEADIGSMYYAEGRYDFGAPHLKRALAAATDSLGASHPWTTTIGGMYATCLREAGKSAEAKSVERAALSKADEAESPFAVWNREIGAADDAIAAKRYSEAEAALKVALQATKELPQEPMLEALTLTRYGQLLLDFNKPAIAIEKWKAAQAIADKVLGTNDEAVLAHAARLAELERANARFAEAEPLYLRLLANAGKKFGADSDEHAKALADVASLYSGWAQYTQAASCYTKLLAWQEKKFGPDSEKLIPTLVALADAEQHNTHYLAEVDNSAEQHFKRAADIAGKHFGKNSRQVVEVWDALSLYYQKVFDWGKAVKTSKMVVAADEKNFGPSSDETTRALERYAAVLRAAGLRNQAQPVEERVAKIKAAKAPADN